ncbi:MAG: hypothetical protein ING73_08145 [Rhodocyclaceae bacterium]|nr:hypothetical protein [Rhodocyclaceae bacterium]MCA3026247.1 hypothetical protein [Rhodocyclaceae bacterium]MCA3032093.1 hypothetical protein [Rhodocyclaceae bacterium]MCA3038182.1 hypothetical protein [Rhodocyclaceae bacterium]MCA3045378.1 hypothetical protein [Rhodocyclaceae bacterium]
MKERKPAVRVTKEAAKLSSTNEYPLTDPELIRNFLSRLSGSEAHLVKVKSGDLEAIQKLLEIVSDGIRVGAPLTQDIAAYLSSALYQISQGENADLALGIKRKHGGRNLVAVRHRNYLIAENIQFLRLLGRTLDQAVVEVAARKGMPEDTAKDAWKKHHKEVMARWPKSIVIPRAKKTKKVA